MRYAPIEAENNLGVAERRVRRRVHPNSLIFININDLNKGIVFNISEDGLALSAGMVLPDSYLSTMQIQFPGSADWTALSGQIVWKSKSKKEAGIKFVGLQEEARQEIKKWISSEATTGELSLEPRAPIGDPKEEKCQKRIFSVSPRGEPLPDPFAPLIGPTKDAHHRSENRTSPAGPPRELSLEPKTLRDESRALSERANDAGKNPTSELLNPGTMAEVQAPNVNVALHRNAVLDELESVVAKRAPQQTQVISGNLYHYEESSPITDRRAHRRTRIVPLGYLQLGESNGGIALNVSEGGLAITAAMVLVIDSLPKMRLQFPDSVDSIETSGEIVWRSQSKREAGVRFVGLTEESRQQIRDWISSQMGGESRLERATPHVFTDTQRVLEEVNLEAPTILAPEAVTPDAAVEPLIPSLNMSAESQTPLDLIPAATEETAVVERHFSSGEIDRESSPSPIPDRRVQSRGRLVPPTYIDIGKSNGGIVLNVSEGGLSLTAAIALDDGPLSCMRFQLPYCSDWIEVNGQVTWKSESGQQAGIKFVDLSEKGQQQIRKWIAAEKLPSSVQRQIEEIRHAENLRMESLLLGLPVPSELVRENSEARYSLPVAGSNPQDAEEPVGASEVAPSTRITSNEALLKVRLRARDRRRNLGFRSRNWRRIGVAAGVIGLITFSVQRIVPKNDAGNNLIAAMARKLEEPSGTLKGKSEIRPLESGTTGAPASSVEKIGSQARRSVALPAAKHPSGGSLPKRQNLTVENIPAPGQVTKESVHNVSGAMSHPVRPTQSQSVGSVPTTLPQLETIIASPVDPVSGLPRDALPVELKKKESSPPPTKLPEGPVNITGLVAIRTDPYPSLRISAKRGSKKTHQGMSLQFGHLISRVEPVYPDEAKQNGIEGTVKLHAVIGRNGSVESLMSVDGPPLLVPVTMGAVRQWRFTETLLGGQSVETEEDVAVTFRLSKSGESKR